MGDRKRILQKNLRLYRWFQILSITPFFLPVVVMLWQQKGLGFAEIYLLQSIFALSMVILEVPTGMIADRVGKKLSLTLGCFVLIFGYAGYGFGEGFRSFVVAEVLIALGQSFLSGADSALLFDTLKALGREGEYRKHESRSRSAQMLSFAVCLLLGGWIGSYSFRLTAFLSGVGPLLGLWIAWRMIEAAPIEPKGPREFWISQKSLLKSAGKFVAKHRFVRWQIAFRAVLLTSTSWLLWMYQPYMQQVGLPIWAFGVAFAGFNIFSAAMCHLSDGLASRLGRERTLVLLVGLSLLPLMFMGLILHPAGVLLILGHQAIRGIGRPLFSDWILQFTYADKRATVLSIASLTSSLFYAATAPLIGWIGSHHSLSQAFLWQAALLTGCFTMLLVFYVRIPAKYFEPKVVGPVVSRA